MGQWLAANKMTSPRPSTVGQPRRVSAFRHPLILKQPLLTCTNWQAAAVVVSEGVFMSFVLSASNDGLTTSLLVRRLPHAGISSRALRIGSD